MTKLREFLNWYVDGFMDEPIMWSIGTILVLTILIGGIRLTLS